MREAEAGSTHTLLAERRAVVFDVSPPLIAATCSIDDLPSRLAVISTPTIVRMVKLRCPKVLQVAWVALDSIGIGHVDDIESARGGEDIEELYAH